MREFLLDKSVIYSIFQNLTGASRARIDTLQKLQIRTEDRILDIGCGPADILEFLPTKVSYTGFDTNKNYINSAKKKYKNRGYFFHGTIDNDLIDNDKLGSNKYDLVFAFGILHHLSDEQVLRLFELARSVLIKGGRLISLDGCYTKKQQSIAKLLLKLDRGDFVRTEKEYVALASYYFTEVRTEVSAAMLRIPYTLIVMECLYK